MLAEPAALSGVAKYYGPACAVAGLDFAIRPGEVTVLLGPNGAGKSTTLNMVAGLRGLVADASASSAVTPAPSRPGAGWA